MLGLNLNHVSLVSKRGSRYPVMFIARTSSAVYLTPNMVDLMKWLYIDGSVQDCSNSIANALELLQSCTKPSICILHISFMIQVPNSEGNLGWWNPHSLAVMFPRKSDVITTCRDHFVNAPSQWETTLHCNIISHWLGAYTKWSLHG